MSGDRAPLLIDTHFWIWIQKGETAAFSRDVGKAIETAADRGALYLSVISVREVALLESKGRLRLTMPCGEWVKRALALPGLSLAAFTPEIAVESCNLPKPFHGDPADRIIVATARVMEAKLLTHDAKIKEYARKRHVSLL